MLILWSGGCDSTLMLKWVLEGRGIFSEKPRDINGHSKELVKTLSVSCNQLPSCVQSRKKRDEFEKWAIKKGFEFQRIEATISDEDNFGLFPDGAMLTQPSTWLSFACLYLNDNEDLCLGYIMGDCALTHKNNLEAIFENHKAMTGLGGKLLFPMEKLRKTEIISYLGEKISMTFWCESPNKNKACGKCTPCVSHRIAEMANEAGLIFPR